MNDLLRDAVERLRSVGIESARADARILFDHAQKLSLSPFGGEGRGEGDYLRSLMDGPPHPNPLLQRGRGDGIFEQLLVRRLAHEPVAYIVGHKEFWSLDFEVGPGVLIPRPETETLIEQALRELPDRGQPYRILDLGTGSGCLLIALLKEYPNATGVGIDSSDAALVWAHRNTAHHGMNDSCELSKLDWAGVGGKFDLIVSNPPYIPSSCIVGLPPDVQNYEPREALDGGSDGLDAYRALGPVLSENLKEGGLALLEIGAGQHHMVGRISESRDLAVTQIEPDLAGIPRCMVVRKSAGER